MSSIPVRRTTRVLRSVKDDENANINVRAPLRPTTRLKPTLSGRTVRAASTTTASKARAVSNEPATKETAGSKRKREALLEVTTMVTNNNKGVGGPTVKGKVRVPGPGAKTISVAKPLSRTGRVPLATTAGKREGFARAESECTIASTTESDSKTGSSHTSVHDPADEKMEVDEPQSMLPLIQEEARDEEEATRLFKKRHTDGKVAGNDSQAEADKVAAELQATELSSANSLWEDLDADDWDDPLMVSEYVVDVCKYLKDVELATMPRPDYMEDQPEITWENRGTLVDWLLQVHARFGLLQESLFLTVNLIDRFLGMRTISLSKLQLVGLACFFIATKYEETYAPSVKEIAILAEGVYTTDEILKAEKYILKTLEWDLRAPGPLGWLRRGSKADNCEVHARTIAKYLIEISCLENKLIGMVPSLISAAALWLARLTLGREIWTPNLEHYTMYSEKDLLPTASIMLEYIITDPVPHESLYKKYAHKRYRRCSTFIRQWCLEWWPDNTSIDLRKDLPLLKAEIVQYRAMMEAELDSKRS